MPVFKANPNDGTVYTRPGGKIASPKIWLFPMSMNTHKVMMLLEMSPIRSSTTIKWIDISGVSGENYSLDYARLNPIMTVPVLEIDDKVITDSYYIYEYLRDNYPGKGDEEVKAQGRTGAMYKFIDLVNDWDEVMYSYGNKGVVPHSVHETGNAMRLVRLKRSYLSAAALPEEKLAAGGTLKEAFLFKLAGISYFSGITGSARPEKKAEKVQKAKDDLRELFVQAERALQTCSPDGGCLFSSKPSSADAMFLSVVHRVNGLFPKEAEGLFADFPRCKAWFRLMHVTKEAQPMLKMSLKSLLPRAIFQWCIPCRLLGYKLGLIREPQLPRDVQSAVDAKVEEMKRLHGTV